MNDGIAPAARMWRSASRSRWPVETPGASSDSMSARTSATIRPERRIFSTSAGDLRVIIRPGVACQSRACEEALGDVLDRLQAVDGDEDALVAVVVGDLVERPELLLHPGADRRLGVVGAVDELRAVDVADAPDLRRLEPVVVDVAAGLADPPAGEPTDEVLDRDLDQERLVDAAAGVGERGIEGLGLGAGPGEAVEDRPGLGVVSLEPGQEQADHHVVGDELARPHDGVDLAPDLAAGRDLGAQQVARGEDGHAQAGGRAAAPACPCRHRVRQAGWLPSCAAAHAAHGEASARRGRGRSRAHLWVREGAPGGRNAAMARQAQHGVSG